MWLCEPGRRVLDLSAAHLHSSTLSVRMSNWAGAPGMIKKKETLAQRYTVKMI